jgi:hypothetical protein
MTFFNSSEPLLRRKQTQLDIQDLEGLIRWNVTIRKRTLLSWLYTRIDQVFLLWGWITAVVFMTPHFFPAVSWSHQAIGWSGLTAIGIVLMISLAWFWVKVERLRWLIYLWSGLMAGGLALTDYGIWAGSGVILVHLCHLWLMVCGVGYGVMGVGMRSRTFLLMAFLHLGTVSLLPLVMGSQFLVTGMIIAGSLFFLAEVQWDMRPPVDSPELTVEQQAFNREQWRLRAEEPTLSQM